MTRDEIIRFAIQCNLVTTGNRDGVYMDALTEFAHLVAAKEREACAKECEFRIMGDNSREDLEARKCATAIRTRGKQA
jgi:hypothetical protein